MQINISLKPILIIIWIIFSLLYIGYDQYQSFKLGTMKAYYDLGKSDTLKAVIDQSQNKDCTPFNIFVQDKKVDLINVACVQQKPSTTNNTLPTTSGSGFTSSTKK